MICPRCGSDTNAGTKFCAQCGHALQPPAEGSQPARRWGVVVAILAVAGLALAGFLNRDRGTPASAAPHVDAFDVSRVADDAATIADLTRAADAGNAQAQFNLAVLHARGAGVPRDLTKARALYERAREGGVHTAARALVYYLWNGAGGPEDRARSLRLLSEAEQANGLDAEGLASLGHHYWFGWGVQVDKTRALTYLRRAASGGYAHANVQLGEAAAGEGRHTEANDYYRKAARAGSGDAAYALYQAYMYGRGVAKDEAQAIDWLRRAARQGHVGAQADVGYEFLAGRTLQMDEAEGLRWSLRAAILGSGPAQHNVAYAFLQAYNKTGRRDLLPIVYAFANLAASQNNTSGAAVRDQIEPLLSGEERAYAQTFSRDFAGGTSSFHQTKISGTGTGFWVDFGRLITNEHVIGECAKLTVRVGQTVLEDVSVLAADADSDLALLSAMPRGEGASYTPRIAAIAASDAPLGEPVIAFGFPLTGVLSSGGALTNGSVSALTGLQDDPVRLQFSAPVQPGNSGGAILNEFADVVGVVQAVLNPITQGQNIVVPQNVNFGIKAGRLREFLAANGISPRARRNPQPLDSRLLAQQAQQMTAQVVCYQNAIEGGIR